MTTQDVTRTGVQAPSALSGMFAGLGGNWLGLVPYFAFCLLFLILPIVYLVTGASRPSTALSR